MNNIKPEVLISRRRISGKVQRLARDIARDYADKNPLLVGILKGSFVFLSDLIRQLEFPLEIDFIRVASYGPGRISTRNVTIISSIRIPVKNRHVLLVEDIIDSGISVNYTIQSIQNEKPASLKICCLLDKPSRREVPVEIDYRGFTVPDKFLVGYGLDCAEQYRNLPDICVLEDE